MSRLNPPVLVFRAASLTLTVWRAATSGTHKLSYLPGPTPDAGAAVSP